MERSQIYVISVEECMDAFESNESMRSEPKHMKQSKKMKASRANQSI